MKSRATLSPLTSKIQALNARLARIRAKSGSAAASATPAPERSSRQVDSKLADLKTRLAKLTAAKPRSK
jgi:hypothetical protein